MNLNNEIGILYVDDEEQSLKYFLRNFGEIGPIFTAKDANQGLDMFRENQSKIGIVVSDRIMPRVNGYEFLEQVRSIDDAPLRMLITANSDLPEAVEALNDGLIYTYLTKPWQADELRKKLLRAKDRFWISREKGKLLKSRDITFQKMLMGEQVSYWESLTAGLNYYVKNAIREVQHFFKKISAQIDGEEIGLQSVDQKLEQILSLIDSLEKGTLSKNTDSSSLKLSTFDLVEIIKEIGSAETARETNVTFCYDGLEKMNIEADEKKIMHLFSGLTQESKRHLGTREGKVEVLTQLQTDDFDKSPVVTIKYTDNGKTLSEDVRKKLFNPFHVHSDRPSEFDVTLLTCYFITYLHGGTILADRENGKNVFVLTIPAAS